MWVLTPGGLSFFVSSKLRALTSDYRKNGLPKVWSASLHPWALTFHNFLIIPMDEDEFVG